MSSVREDRQRQIRVLVRSGGIRTQHGLVTALKEHGFDVTQATVSRDISDLDLQKDEKGFYALAEDLRFKTILTATGRATKRAGNQVLLFTEPGSASSVAAALDSALPEGVLGSIAGDDTILVITADEKAGELFQKRVDSMLSNK